MSFDEETLRQIQSYRDELIAILNGDVEELIASHGLEPEEGEEASVFDFTNNVLLGNLEPMSGLKLDDRFECEVFDDNTSFVVFHRTSGGPNVDYIVGSDGDAFLRYSYGEQKIERIPGNHEYSVLFEMAEMIYGKQFTEIELDDDEIFLRLKKDLGVDSFEEFITDNADIKQGDVVPFATVLEFLKDNDYNFEEAVQAIIRNDEYYVCNEKGEDFSPEDFVKDIKAHLETLEEVVLNSEFENVCSVFSIDADKITEIDFDYLEDEIKEAFEPEETEVKKTNKRKP